MDITEEKELQIKVKHTAIICQGIIEALDEINTTGKVSIITMTNLKKQLAMMLLELNNPLIQDLNFKHDEFEDI